MTLTSYTISAIIIVFGGIVLGDILFVGKVFVIIVLGDILFVGKVFGGIVLVGMSLAKK